MNLIVKEESEDTGRVEVRNGKMRTEQIRNELDKITAALVVRFSSNHNPICNTSPAVLFSWSEKKSTNILRTG